MALSLADIYEELRACGTECEYEGLPINEFPMYFARNSEGLYAFLILSKDSSIPLSLQTDGLSLNLNRECRFFDGHKKYSDKLFHILQCEVSDEYIIEKFLILCNALAERLVHETNVGDSLLDFFYSLGELFRITSVADTTNKRQGLWGELFLMKHYGNFKRLGPSWHIEPTRVFDFYSGINRLEVKTTSTQDRIHSFSHRQVFDDTGKKIVVASFILVPDEAGTSLKQLLDQARTVMKGDLGFLVKLEKEAKLSNMLARDEEGPCFDELAAIKGLHWFSVEDIPRFSQPEPQGVTNTRYNIDLTSSKCLTSHEVDSIFSTWE